MLPHFNSHLYNPNNNNNNNQPQTNGNNASAAQQVMGNPGNFCPNPMQMLPQFQLGMLNNPQLAMPPFNNPNSYFAPNQLFPFPQAPMQNLNNSNLHQFIAYNASNPPQFFPNGQFNVPNLGQNLNQLLQMQMPNAHMGLLNGNGVVQPPVNGNASKQMNPNTLQQGNLGAVNGVNKMEKSWNQSHNKNSTWNPKRDASQRGFPKQQFHRRQNAKGNFKSNNYNQVKDQENFGATSFNNSGSCKPNQEGKKRSVVLNYTAQEIQQWREERKKNYPSRANTEKNLKENVVEPEDTDAVSKARRQQLKEILAKQAELGCEVADIPSSYLSDSEQKADSRGVNKRVFAKTERFQNKFDKRGKFHQNDRFSKRQRPMNQDPANVQRLKSGSTVKSEPSLLKKLLSSDIKRDKKHLLQVFRFMTTNSFFKNWPQESLKFPEVIVKESGIASEIVEEIAQVL
ncbi:hypothetical protein ACJIZ3_018647 [Penstemon smallii]|uniref:FMR1-interacting protein 1 conserved domain-containing protein n=1 Tax=Penstemon smallii TaxID=265156 RepID=A0ABD3SZF6_9LAMI